MSQEPSRPLQQPSLVQEQPTTSGRDHPSRHTELSTQSLGKHRASLSLKAISKRKFGLAGVQWGTNKVHAYNNPAFESFIEGALKDGISCSRTADVTAYQKAIDIPDNRTLAETMFPNHKRLLRRMQWEALAVYMLVIAHVMVMGWTDPIFTRMPGPQVLVLIVQFGLLVAIAMAFFVLTSHTLLIQLGRYDLYLREFGWVWGSWLVELLLLIALKAYQVLLVFQRAPYLGLWENPGYYALWVIQRIVLLGFWLFTSYGVIGAFSTQQFDPWAIVKGDLVMKPREGEVGDEVILPVSSGRSGTARKSHHPSPSRTGMQ